MGSDQPKMSPQTLAVLNVLVEQPYDWFYGLELIDQLGLKGGTIYPLLARLERHGWLEGKRESLDPAAAGRPRRKLYRLTGEGQRRSIDALEQMRSMLGMPSARSGSLNPGAAF